MNRFVLNFTLLVRVLVSWGRFVLIFPAPSCIFCTLLLCTVGGLLWTLRTVSVSPTWDTSSEVCRSCSSELTVDLAVDVGNLEVWYCPLWAVEVASRLSAVVPVLLEVKTSGWPWAWLLRNKVGSKVWFGNWCVSLWMKGTMGFKNCLFLLLTLPDPSKHPQDWGMDTGYIRVVSI